MWNLKHPKQMRKIDKIVVHCADTPAGKHFDIHDIRKWHTDPKPQGRGWKDVGYHYVVLLNGTIQVGRPHETPGAHVQGHNAESIGICYIGGGKGLDTRTNEQKVSLIYLIGTLRRLYPLAKVWGHRDFLGVTKMCPCFDASKEYKYL